MLFGLILILMMIYRPAGLIPAARRKRELTQEEEATDLAANEENGKEQGEE
jgi:hypothetical protein